MAITRFVQNAMAPINTGSDNTLAGKVDNANAETARGYVKAAAFLGDGAATTLVLPEPARALLGNMVVAGDNSMASDANQRAITLGADAKTVTVGGAALPNTNKIIIFYVN